MAGIYIHVPYCTTRCIYCDFFTQTNISSQPDYVSAICKEADLRKDYLKHDKIKTIYFGGGTPSLLSYKNIEAIFRAIYDSYDVDKDSEITLEANPDDLSDNYLKLLRDLPFNRLSIGIQSFDDAELQFLNRRHTSKTAVDAVKRAQIHGFDNISIDLIYGIPNLTLDKWIRNLKKAIDLDIQHISSYHLIYEDGTKLFQLLQKGEISEIGEDESFQMFFVMIDTLLDAGFEHYEISNFAKEGNYSKHNTSYWQNEKYLGLGPAAHSFDGVNRAFNIPSISEYINGINEKCPRTEIEVLEEKSRYNDFILTGLRTKWGVDLYLLENLFGESFLKYCLSNADKYLLTRHIVRENSVIKLSREGIFISDTIISDLMKV